ncbi:hypothetical protein Sjap_001987 [Stephania japonica]|uniref:Uncharacterized protein n=1 Tax=Stephania japonica TaxID=461633 RepID=A0AAP0PS79_9MAGN
MTSSYRKKINPTPKRRRVKDKDVSVEAPVRIEGSCIPSIDFAHNSKAVEDSAACPSTTSRSTGDAAEICTSFLGGPPGLSLLPSFKNHILWTFGITTYTLRSSFIC